MIRRLFVVVVLFVAGFVLSGMGTLPQAEVPPRMTTEELRARLGAPDTVVIDVRAGKDWKGSNRKIAGAVREDPGAVGEWAGKYPREKTIVLYCA
jgi:hypothetical protein